MHQCSLSRVQTKLAPTVLCIHVIQIRMSLASWLKPSSLVDDPEGRVLPHHAVVVLVDLVVRDGVRVEAAEGAPLC